MSEFNPNFNGLIPQNQAQEIARTDQLRADFEAKEAAENAAREAATALAFEANDQLNAKNVLDAEAQTTRQLDQDAAERLFGTPDRQVYNPTTRKYDTVPGTEGELVAMSKRGGDDAHAAKSISASLSNKVSKGLGMAEAEMSVNAAREGQLAEASTDELHDLGFTPRQIREIKSRTVEGLFARGLSHAEVADISTERLRDKEDFDNGKYDTDIADAAKRIAANQAASMATDPALVHPISAERLRELAVNEVLRTLDRRDQQRVEAALENSPLVKAKRIRAEYEQKQAAAEQQRQEALMDEADTAHSALGTPTVERTRAGVEIREWTDAQGRPTRLVEFNPRTGLTTTLEYDVDAAGSRTPTVRRQTNYQFRAGRNNAAGEVEVVAYEPTGTNGQNNRVARGTVSRDNTVGNLLTTGNEDPSNGETYQDIIDAIEQELIANNGNTNTSGNGNQAPAHGRIRRNLGRLATLGRRNNNNANNGPGNLTPRQQRRQGRRNLRAAAQARRNGNGLIQGLQQNPPRRNP